MKVMAFVGSPRKGSNVDILIDKVIEGQKTETKVRTLNSSERQKEIARMLSGDETSKISIENAQEMMENAQKFKALS